jgi:hypothetical protein
MGNAAASGSGVISMHRLDVPYEIFNPTSLASDKKAAGRFLADSTINLSINKQLQIFLPLHGFLVV